MRFRYISSLTIVLSLLILLPAIFPSCKGESTDNGSSNQTTFSPLFHALTFGGWHRVNLEGSFNDGFALYGCRKLDVKDTRVGSVDFEGGLSFDYDGSVGGMGEIKIEGKSFISGDLTYSPEGTYSVGGDVDIEGVEYSYGISECPWWSYGGEVSGGGGGYPLYLTVSSSDEVTLPAGEYHFKKLVVKGGFSVGYDEIFQGYGNRVYVDEMYVEGGKVDLGLGVVIAKRYVENGGEFRGRLYGEKVSVVGGRVIGKVVGEDVYVGDSDIYWNGEMICKSKDKVCKVLTAIYSRDYWEKIIEEFESVSEERSILEGTVVKNNLFVKRYAYLSPLSMGYYVNSRMGKKKLENILEVLVRQGYSMGGYGVEDYRQPDEYYLSTFTALNIYSHDPDEAPGNLWRLFRLFYGSGIEVVYYGVVTSPVYIYSLGELVKERKQEGCSYPDGITSDTFQYGYDDRFYNPCEDVFYREGWGAWIGIMHLFFDIRKDLTDDIKEKFKEEEGKYGVLSPILYDFHFSDSDDLLGVIFPRKVTEDWIEAHEISFYFPLLKDLAKIKGFENAHFGGEGEIKLTLSSSY